MFTYRYALSLFEQRTTYCGRFSQLASSATSLYVNAVSPSSSTVASRPLFSASPSVLANSHSGTGRTALTANPSLTARQNSGHPNRKKLRKPYRYTHYSSKVSRNSYKFLSVLSRCSYHTVLYFVDRAS
jgi:hypothetical protein